MAQVFLGQIIHTKSVNDFEIFTDGFVAVDASGKIVGVGNDYNEWRNKNRQFDSFQEVKLTCEQFLMPGFVDCHIHAPQVAQIGLGLDLPLLQWLNTYTFPLEARFADKEFALNVYRKVVELTIKCGTTLASYFGTNHLESTLILAKEALRQGQRALVGKVCSNCNVPKYYMESTESSVMATQKFIAEMFNLKTDLVKPTVTPRFAISCDKELLVKLASIADKYKLHIQSHISESLPEIEMVKRIYETSYAKAYDNAGLLTRKTVLAHGVHLGDDEIQLLKERGTSIAHCPASNTMLSSGICDIVRLLQKGVICGLGTDVSGGNSPSIQHAMVRALEVSHHLEFVKNHDIKGTGRVVSEEATPQKYIPLNYKEAIFLGTLGGAEALALDKVTGNFVVGKEFDALIIDTSKYPLFNFQSLYKEPNKTPERRLLELVQKFVYVGDERNIIQVFVAGKQVKNVN